MVVTLKKKYNEALIRFQDTNRKLTVLIAKYPNDKSLVTLLGKVKALELLLVDSYETTIKNKNISNSDALKNLRLMFKTSGDINTIVSGID